MIHETTGSRPWTLALTSVAFFMVALDMLVVITALPAIRREFGASLAALPSGRRVGRTLLVFQGPFDLALGGFFAQRLALVVELLAAGEPELDLGAAVLEV